MIDSHIDKETIGSYCPDFARKSDMQTSIDGEQILRLEKYRESLDALMMGMDCNERLARQMIMSESQRVVHFLNNLQI